MSEKVNIKIIKKNKRNNFLKFLFPKNLFFPVLSGFVFAGIFSAVFFVFALPYSPGETTNPTCAPTDANCTVSPSAVYSFTTNNFSGTGNFTGGTITGTTITDGTLSIASGSITSGVDANFSGTGSFASLTLTTNALTVGNGGTGVSSFTPYAVLTGGTSLTGALQQVSGLGISGQVLTSNGDGALPTWQDASGGADTALSNLASVAINASLLPGTDNSIDLGSSANQWANLYTVGITASGSIGAGAITGTSFIIGANTLDTNEWAYLDGQDQAVKTTDSPTFANITDSGLTATRVPYASTAGLLVDSANLTFNGTTLTAGGFSTSGSIGAGAITGTSFIIGANTLDTNEWAYLDGQDQAVKTTSDVIHNKITLGAGGAGTDYQFLSVNGETNDLDLTWMEDEASLKANSGLWLDGATGTTPTSGAGTRLMWIPSKYAFRAGRVTGTNWDAANIGDYSAAFGLNAKASGTYSVAFGASQSTGFSSVAFGSSTASEEGAVSFGYNSKASGTSSLASGEYVVASGYGSVAFGYNENEDDTSFVASGNGSIAIGIASYMDTHKATGVGSIVMGDSVNSLGNNIISFGKDFTASTASTFNIGFGQLDYEFTATAADFKNSSLTTTGAIIGGSYAVGASAGVSDTYDDGVDTQITFTGGIATAISTAFDERLLTNINPIGEVLPRIGSIRVATYNWSETGLQQFPEKQRSDKSATELMGFVAQDFQDTFPEILEQKGDYITYNRNYLESIMMKAIQELNQKVNALGGENIGIIDPTELSSSGSVGNGSVSGVNTMSLKGSLVSLGLKLVDGVATLKEVVADKFSVKIARMEKMEMIDSSTGQVWCTWIENGEWKKVEGECNLVNTETVISQTPQQEEIVEELNNESNNEEINSSLVTPEQLQQIVQEVAQVATQQTTQQVQEATNTAQSAASQASQASEQAQSAANDAKEAKEAVEKINKKTSLEKAEISTEEAVLLEPEIIEEEVIEPEVIEEQPDEEIVQVEEIKPEVPLESVGDLIQEASASLLNSIWDFTKELLGSTLKGVISLIPSSVKFSTASLSRSVVENVNSDFSGLLSQIKLAQEAVIKLFKK